MKTAEIIIIGNEILNGKTKDTNSQFLSNLLVQKGIQVKRIISILDNYDDIVAVLQPNTANVNLRFISGGLGPTNDDITKDALCKVFNSTLVFNNDIAIHLEQFFSKRNKPFTETNRKQALVPDNASIIQNDVGTASVLVFETESQLTFALPGVPFEFEWLVANRIIPYIENKLYCTEKLHSSDFIFIGIGESFLFDAVKSQTSVFQRNCEVAFLPSPGIVRIRISYTNKLFEVEQNNLFEIIDAEFKQKFPDVYIGRDLLPLEQMIQQICISNKLTLSLAESCTGGYLSHLFTSNPGSSAFFKGAIIAYSNEIKTKIINVNESIIEAYGAVSKEVVVEMALGALKEFQSDYAISVSGIAGPDGGSPEKPVGTVWICVSNGQHSETQLLHLGETSRTVNIRKASLHALHLLYLVLQNQLK